jgi:hypothetical protein
MRASYPNASTAGTRGRHGLEIALGLSPLAVLATTSCLLPEAPDSSTGWPALLLHVHSLAVAWGIFCGAAALGEGLARGVLKTAQPSIGLRFVLGYGLLGLLGLLLGTVGLAQRSVLVGSGVVILGLTCRVTGRLLASMARLVRHSVRIGPWSAAAAFLGLHLLLGLAVALLPVIDYDSYTYHLAYPEKLLALQSWTRIDPVFHYANALLVQTANVYCLAAQAPRAAALLQWLALVLTLWEVYRLGRTILGHERALLAVLLIVTSTLPVATATTPKIDTYFMLCTVLLVHEVLGVVYFRGQSRADSAILGGVLLGIALSVKYSAVVFAALLLAMVFPALWLEGWTLRRASRWCAAVLVVAGLTAAPWYLRNAYLYETLLPIPSAVGLQKTWFRPVPHVGYFTAEDFRTVDPVAQAVQQQHRQAIADLDAELARKARWSAARNPWKLWDVFVNPYRYLRTGDLFEFVPNYLLVLLVPAPFLLARDWRRKEPSARPLVLLLVLSGVCYFVFMRMSYIIRYVLPVYPFLCIVVAYVLSRTLRALLRDPLASWTAGLVLALLILVCNVKTFQLLERRQGVPYLTGVKSERRTVQETVPYVRDWMTMKDFMERRLPRTSQILFVHEPRTYGLSHRVLPDDSFFGSAFLQFVAKGESLEGAASLLRAQGFTHVLFAGDREWWLASVAGMSGPELLRPAVAFRAFAQRHLVPIYSTKATILYRLREGVDPQQVSQP